MGLSMKPQVTATPTVDRSNYTHTAIQACTHIHTNCIINTASIYD